MKYKPGELVYLNVHWTNTSGKQFAVIIKPASGDNWDSYNTLYLQNDMKLFYLLTSELEREI